MYPLEKFISVYDYVAKSESDILSKEKDYLLSNDLLEISDIQVFKKGGRDWLIEPLKERQPLSYQVLEEHASEYMVGFFWYRFPPNPHVPKNKLIHHGFLIVKELIVGVSIQNNLVSSEAFPDEIRTSWLNRAKGWGYLFEPYPIFARGLVGGTMSSRGVDEYLLIDKDKMLQVIQEKIPNLYDDSRVRFRCFLDSRLPDDGSIIGDQLYILEEDPEKRVYWVKDCNFKQMYYLENPGEAIDAYSAHTLLQKEGRFDFSPWAKPW